MPFIYLPAPEDRIISANALFLAVQLITVPGDAAEEVIGRVVSSGMKAILNFAPIKVKVPDFVSLVNIDFSVELERLSCLAIRRD